MEIKVGEPTTPPPNLPSPTPFPTPTNVVLPSFAERGEDVDVDDDGVNEPQRPTPVGGQSIWNLFSPVKDETSAPEKRRDSAMSLATPANDDMSLASPEAPVAARHVSEPPDTPAPESPKPRETEASKMSFLSVFSFGGSPTSQDTPTPVQPAADEVVEIKVPAPAPEPAVEVKKEEPQPAPAKKACCVVC